MEDPLTDLKLGIIGLGYVGLPLAVEFAKFYDVLGFDISESRIDELKLGHDSTLEISDADLKNSHGLRFSFDNRDLAHCNVYIVTVPTPVDKDNEPNLGPLCKASELIGEFVEKDNVVIYESTVYPGATEEVCLPIVERVSGLQYNRDFFAGYSPERVNPGDKTNKLREIKKITSGSTPEVGDFVNRLYSSIITAGTYLAGSIKVAEAAKVIENTQRDLNIAIVNEFSKIFNCLDIDTEEVLEAARTKWNFLDFQPGLVGGHCISVDPYYLTHKAIASGYYPELILSGRKINGSMGSYISSQLLRALKDKGVETLHAEILILGFTFKGNCTDIRNTKVVDILQDLVANGLKVDVYDPWANDSEVFLEYGFHLIESPEQGKYDGIVLAVDHLIFENWGREKITEFGRDKHVFYDVKSVFDKNESDLRL